MDTLHDALSPLLSVDSDSEGPSDDDSGSVISEGHEAPDTVLDGQAGVQDEGLLNEENETQDPVVILAREYQLEMFEESLKRNIIVAMETGAGKTQVAVLRIQAELEKSTPDKIIWFLAPSVALCEQQFRVLRSQIRSVQIKLLCGADSPETWTDVRTWDDFLRNVRVVVSTHQVLLDAVSHAFVRIDRLSLLIFDEAHNCVGKHPGSLIMARYRENKTAGLPIPSILGLTASPIMKSNLNALETIESTLDCICKSPTIHREELMSIVKRPMMYHISYTQPDGIPFTNTMDSLARVYFSLDIYQDPYIIRLRADNSERARVALIKALEKKNTYVFSQMHSLWRKSCEIQKELGSWAADYFISLSVHQFLKSYKNNDQWFQDWAMEEKRYLANALGGVRISSPPSFEDSIAHIEISDKVSTLLEELSRTPDDSTGIIFVQEIATVAVLTHILSVHPLTKDRFRVGSMVGTSNWPGKKRDIGSLVRENSSQDLEAFRDGRLNLLVGTSVLEEGIDVPACNMVICFDSPANLKAFIQRRGRARMRESRLVLLMNISKNTGQIQEWTILEQEMKKRYEDDMRKLQELEESEQPEVQPLYVPETGAKLSFDQAKSHLEHFCTKLSMRRYADLRPYYIFKRTQDSLDDTPSISATVVLPMLLPPDLRRVEGRECWQTEKNASKDAAFQAYVAIYKAGLLNDNLLPLKDEFLLEARIRVGETEVDEVWNPWTRIAHAWGSQLELYRRQLRLVDEQGDILCNFEASLPIPFPKLPDFKVFWDRSTTWKVEAGEIEVVYAHDLQAEQGSALLDLAWGHRNLKLKDDAQLPLHIYSPSQDIPFRQLRGQKPIEEACLSDTVLIRNSHGYPCSFKAWLPSLDPNAKVTSMLLEEPRDVPWLLMDKWTKRKDFLHPIPDDIASVISSKPTQLVWPVHLCKMDGIHIANAYFGALLPGIMHMMEINMIAGELCNTLMKEVGFSDISLVITAITAPSSNGCTNYQRLEFLGDSILKMLTTAAVTANNPLFPEGYLDAIKTNIVSNARLCRAAVETGLDRFILKKRFTAAKWQPLYVEDLTKAGADAAQKRKMSTKTLADVVESLIGAAYLDGGMSKALACVQVFLPEVEWLSFDDACSKLFSQTAMSTQLVDALVPLEEMIGHSFRNKNLLVEAATHSSFGLVNSTSSAGSCMERLEFLGDAVLDSIIVSAVWPHDLDQRDMHLLRTASVNADLLGFLGMEWSASQDVTSITKDRRTVATQTKIPFCRFMRYVSPDMGAAQRAAEERYAAERHIVLDAIRHGTEYPWAPLAHLHIPKFFSDFFESVLGAVWVDSGSMDACARVAERAGILPYLRRMLADAVDVLHPKNHLGELAGKDLKTVKYQTEVRERADGAKELCCRILVAGEVVVDVGGGLSPEEVQAKAADLAYKILLERKRAEVQATTA